MSAAFTKGFSKNSCMLFKLRLFSFPIGSGETGLRGPGETVLLLFSEIWMSDLFNLSFLIFTIFDEDENS